jgi:hypothetical protein
MPTTRLELLNRISSLCVGDPFRMTEAGDWNDFDKQPTGTIDQAFRIIAAQESVIGGTNYSEERTDLFTVWVARKQNADPLASRRLLVTDVTSLTAAIVRDGSTGGGDYAVLDGGSAEIEHESGKEYAVARLALLINYEATL